MAIVKPKSSLLTNKEHKLTVLQLLHKQTQQKVAKLNEKTGSKQLRNKKKNDRKQRLNKSKLEVANATHTKLQVAHEPKTKQEVKYLVRQ